MRGVEGRLPVALGPSDYRRGLLVAPVSTMALTEMAYADASPSVEGSHDGAMVTQLEKGEKPELIQRADEQVKFLGMWYRAVRCISFLILEIMYG